MSFAETWGSTTVSDNDRSEAPAPGTYEVAIEDAKAFTSKAGDDWFVVELKIITGDQAGHQWAVLSKLSTEGGVKAAKSMCSRMGVPVNAITSLDELDTAAKTVVGQYFAADVVQKGEYRNTYIGDRLTGVEPVSDVPSDVPAEGAAPDDDDDIPF